MADVLLPATILWAGVLILGTMVNPRSPLYRAAVFTGFAAFGLRYFEWRTTQSLPDADLPLEPSLLLVLQWLWPIAFLAIELVRFGIDGFSLGLLVRPARPKPDHATASPARRPRVDALIPTYREPVAVVERTVLGARALRGAELRVWVLDDAANDEIEQLCRSLSVEYLRRPLEPRVPGKAGNVNFGLAHTADEHAGEFVVLVDADHVLHPRFVSSTLPYFDDPTVGAVQTPQSFFNGEPHQENLGLAQSVPDDQRMFFESLQEGKDAWGLAFCCGTGCMLRRRALDDIGGVPTSTVTEDLQTTYALACNGWTTRYHNEPLSKGLAAESVTEFIAQRVRWCQGTIQGLYTGQGPFGLNRLGLLERIHYLSLALSWMTSPFALATCLAPLLYWWLGVWTMDADVTTFLDHFIPYAFGHWVFSYLAGRRRQSPLLGQVLGLITAPYLVPAIFRALLNPFGIAFRVTGKGARPDRVVVHWPLVTFFALATLAYAIALIANGVPEYRMRELDDGLSLNLLWSCYCLVLLVLATLVCIDVPRRRANDRFALDETGLLETGDGTRWQVRLIDLSVTGARLESGRVEGLPNRFRVALEGVGWVSATLVRRDGRLAGVRLRASPNRRRALILKLYASDLDSVTRVFRPARAAAQTLRKLLA